MTHETASLRQQWTCPPGAKLGYRLRRSRRGWRADSVAAGSEPTDALAAAGPQLLIDLPNWLGDFMMALPATDRLVRANPTGRTILHVRPASARLAATLFPNVQVVATPRRQAPLLTSRQLANGAKRADIGVTLRNASRAKILLWLAARWRLGTSSQGGGLLLSWSHRVAGDRHQVHDADPLLGHLGLPGADPKWRAHLPPSSRSGGIDALRSAGLGGGHSVIGLAPGVARGGSAKQWPATGFGRLAKALENRGFSPVILIGPGERSLARSVAAASGLDLPIVGEDLDAVGLAGVLCSTDAVVGNDSGPVHTAAMFGIPSLALFGPTDPRRTAPLGTTAKVVSLGADCSPCLQSRCPLHHCDCMRRLSVEQVEAELSVLIGQRGRSVSRAVHA